MKRKQFFIIIIGGNGCGKTTLMLKIAQMYFKANPKKRGLIGVADDGEKKLRGFKYITKQQLRVFTGIKKIMIEEEQDFLDIANTYKPVYNEKTGQFDCNQFDGLMIFDDLGGVMSRRPEPLLKFLKKRRQPNVDILMVFHGLRADTPPSLYSYANKIILFKTSDDPEGATKNLAPTVKEKFMKAYDRVQSHPDPHYYEEIEINTLSI